MNDLLNLNTEYKNKIKERDEAINLAKSKTNEVEKLGCELDQKLTKLRFYDWKSSVIKMGNDYFYIDKMVGEKYLSIQRIEIPEVETQSNYLVVSLQDFGF